MYLVNVGRYLFITLFRCLVCIHGLGLIAYEFTSDFSFDELVVLLLL